MLTQKEQFALIWKNALEDYEAVTNKKLDDPKLPKLNSVDDLISSLDTNEKDFKKYREKNHMFFQVLSGALKPVELVGNLAAGGTAMTFPPSSLIFGAVTYLIQAANGVSAKYNAINDLFVTLKDFTVRLSVYTRESISDELREKLAQVLTTLISIFALSRMAIKEGRLLAYGRNFLLGSNDKVKAAVGRLDSLTQSEDRLVGAETLTESKRVGRTLDGVAVTVMASNAAMQEHGVVLSSVDVDVKEIHREVVLLAQIMNENMAESREEKDQKYQDKIKEVLRPSVHAQDLYDHITKTRVAGTGDWIRDEQLFQLWLQRTTSVLWISGNPGAGKSYLSANIISLLRENNPQGVQSTTHVSVGYFFFKDNNPETRSFHQALRDLAYQISQNDPVYAKHVLSSCQSQDDIKTIASVWRKLYLEFFIDGADTASSLYIVLDGIDEAYEHERKMFLELLKDLKRQPADRLPRIQLAMVGRPQLLDELTEALENEYLSTIDVTGEKTSKDIVQYILTSIRKSKILKLVSQDVKNQIVEKLSSGAQGMFIWVDLMLQELYKKKRPSAILDALNMAPKGLREMLRHVLESFSATLQDEDPDDLNELLAWVTCIERPLKLGELDMILRLKSPSGDGMISLENSLRRQFASFFSLTREDGLTTADLQRISTRSLGLDLDANYEIDKREEEGLDDIENTTDFDSNPRTTEVTFCHASIGDFFRDETEGQVSAGEDYPLVGVTLSEAKVSVCKTCLDLLSDKATRGKNVVSTTDNASAMSMIPYAFSNWHKHLQNVDRSKTSKKSKQAIGKSLVKMFRDKDVLPLWAGGIGWNFFRDDYLSLIRSWLDDPEVIAGLTPEDEAWIQKTAETPSSVFTALSHVIAEKWLQSIFQYAPNCFRILYAAIELEKGTPVGTSLDFKPTAAEILRVAEWAGLEQNATWYRVVAITMRDCALHDDALEYFEKSMKLDPTLWLISAGMAKTYVLKKDWTKAIQWDAAGEKILLEDLEKLRDQAPTIKLTELHIVRERMAECYNKLHDSENELKYLRKAFESKIDCYKCAYGCVLNLHVSERHADIMGLLMGMRDKVTGKEHTRLSEFLWDDLHDDNFELIFRLAARKTDNQQFLAEVYHDTVIAARQELKPISAYEHETWLAGIYYTELKEVDKAIRIWQRLNHMAGVGAKQESLMGILRYEATTKLSMAYFQRALVAPKGSPDQAAAVKALERLVLTKINASDERKEVISAAPAGIILGQWYKLNGRTDEANVCFKVHIKEALHILSDDDPDNDMEGYQQLATVLLAAGYDAEAIALYHFVTAAAATNQDSVENNEDTPDKGIVETGEKDGNETTDDADDVQHKRVKDEDEKVKEKEVGNVEEEEEGGGSNDDDEDEETDDEDPDIFSCDGVCGKTFKNLCNMLICRYCYDVGFCNDCLTLVKEDKMPLNVCASNHDWLLVEPPSREPKRGIILVGEVEFGLEEFKEYLRKEWKV